jgi:endonuclease III
MTKKTKQERVSQLAKRLAQTYQSPRLGNKDDPLDELVFILLSQMTTGPSYERVFDRLKDEIGAWSQLRSIREQDLIRIISDAGLANQKAPRLKAIAERVFTDFGPDGLDALRSMETRQAETYLTTLPGVGVKTAKCVLMYALGREVLPVDTHVGRVARRLGLVPSDMPGSRVHDALEAVVPPELRYAFHVNAVVHGRAVCKARNPKCDVCLLSDLCSTGRSRLRPPRSTSQRAA